MAKNLWYIHEKRGLICFRFIGANRAGVLLAALGRQHVFIDEADQVLGRRGAGAGDGGVSAGLYSVIAEEMSRPDIRGRVIWILAPTRPVSIKVDLKRPGQIDIRLRHYSSVNRIR